MAFKWSKASRAKLNRSQKARWKERKTIGSALNVPPDSGDVVLHKPMRYTPKLRGVVYDLAQRACVARRLARRDENGDGDQPQPVA
jgi:hypothetical protein